MLDYKIRSWRENWLDIEDNVPSKRCFYNENCLVLNNVRVVFHCFPLEYLESAEREEKDGYNTFRNNLKE